MTTLLAPTTVLPSLMDDEFGFQGPFLDADPWTMSSRMFNTPFFRNAALPAVNIKDNAKTFDLELAVPGYRKEDLKVKVEDGMLTIFSEKKKENDVEKNGFTRREFNYRSFMRSFQLPENADEDNVKANYVDGILKLSIPKTKALPVKRGKEVRIV